MATARNGVPEFWATTIAKVLAGDQSCLLAPWHRARFRWPKKPQSPQMAQYKADHTAMLQDTVAKMRADGWGCRLEQYFNVPGHYAAIAGKADLVAKQQDKRPLIVDVKTGDPRESDVIQVLIEMVMIPISWNAPSMLFNGQVIYRAHTVDLTPADAEAMKPKMFAMLKRLGTIPQPEPSPGKGVCLYCDMPDCAARWREDEEQAVTTDLF